jgi:23S rRNA (adenine2503-C2)-methyltransferase
MEGLMSAPNQMEISRRFISEDGITTKYLLRVGSTLIECTYVDRPEKHIICFSTAIGCPIACVFCCAGAYKRGLESQELFEQARLVAEDSAAAVRTHKPLLFSAMGEGEPLLTEASTAALVEAFLRLQRRFPAARFAVSTTGVRPQLIRWLADNLHGLRVKLQLSIHGATDAVRKGLVPVGAPVSEVVEAARYFESRHPTLVEWNYVLVGGVNDLDSDADALAGLMGESARIKLNRLNPIPDGAARRSQRADRFAERLHSRGLTTEFYATDGVDIAAACGQLRSRSLSAHAAFDESAAHLASS